MPSSRARVGASIQLGPVSQEWSESPAVKLARVRYPLSSGKCVLRSTPSLTYHRRIGQRLA